MQDWTSIALPLAGGALMGLAAAIMLLLNGRVLGMTGILSGILTLRQSGAQWRWVFLAGLLAGGWLLLVVYPGTMAVNPSQPLWVIAAAGVLVGFGARLGGGCTSGHGICGVGRGAPRSLVATGLFLVAGALGVAAGRVLGGLS